MTPALIVAPFLPYACDQTLWISMTKPVLQSLLPLARTPRQSLKLQPQRVSGDATSVASLLLAWVARC